MKFIKTEIPGVFIIEPQVFKDSRGYFFESYSKKDFSGYCLSDNFVQDNQSKSSYGTIRGLHFQKGVYAQAKLVRVIHGTVLDIAVDLRKNSPTFGKHIAVELDGEKNNMLFIPRDFAHGFAVLSETALFSYKCDNYYNKESEGGILYNDPDLNINWGIPKDKIITSDKDALWPTFNKWKSEKTK